MRTRWLYLDFDGVLHPNEVHFNERHEPQLHCSGHLFMWQHRLLDALVCHRDVRLILSTNWVSHYGLERTASYLCEELRRRVVGTSTPARPRRPLEFWSCANEVERHLREHSPAEWVIVDNDSCDWSALSCERLVLCDSFKGLGDDATLERLHALLADSRRG